MIRFTAAMVRDLPFVHLHSMRPKRKPVLRLKAEDGSVQWLITEGDRMTKTHYKFYGCIVTDKRRWGFFSSEKLRATERTIGQKIILDTDPL